MIEIEQLRKRYGRIDAVASIDLCAPAAAITTLLGGNGSGKTTTLRSIFGLIRADGGNVRVAGIDVTRDPLAARRLLGYFPDKPGLNPRLTPIEHWQFAAHLHGLDRAGRRQRIAQLIDELAMEQLAHRPVQGFSTGERMLVALGRALVHEPRYLVLDEPNRGLDIENLRRLRRLLRRQRDSGTCVLMSSHALQEVEALSDRIVVIGNGCSLATGTLAELLDRAGADSLERAYLNLTTQAGVAA